MEGDVEREYKYDCERMLGCRDLHSICFFDAMEVDKLMKQNLACFCFFCIEGKLGGL